MVVKIGVVKLGNIGCSPLLELILDERADREDIDVRVISSGAKLTPAHAEEVATKILDFKPDLAIIASPNEALPGPRKAAEIVSNAGVPAIIISDSPAKKAVKDFEAKGLGYILVEGDAMIGARREFLDPAEMAIFNADIIKALTITGVFNLLRDEIDRVIDEVEAGAKPSLPKIIVDKELAVKAADFHNPYAKVKAMAAYEMLRKAAELDVEGCFMVKEAERYIPIVAAAHEMVRIAALLADEAREIEKSEDMVARKPHHKDGAILTKRQLLEKPKKPEE